MGISGVSSGYNYYDYNSMLNSTSWAEKAEKDAEQIKSSTTSKTSGTSSASGSNSYVNSSNASTSTFLLGYQSTLEDLEAASSKLQIYQKDNVFQKYEEKLAAANKPGADEAARKAADSALDDIVAAVKDFANKYNDTVSYMSANASRGSGVANQLEAFKRMIPTEQGLKTLGMKVDTNGKLQVNEDKLKDALGEIYNHVKETIGGQYGIADRVGSRATYVLDSPVDKIVDGNTTTSASSSAADSANKGSSSSSSASGSTGTAKASSMSDSFMQFANFAKGGAFNLTNYYAVSMLNILA